MSNDQAKSNVINALNQIQNLSALLGNAIRQGIDSVIDGPRTNRWSVDELEKTEKAYIGTRVEILVRSALGVQLGKVLDYLIAGHEVDSKFSISFGGWMIPQEAVDQLCLLICTDKASKLFWVGLVRAEESVLTTGANQDKKRSISASGRSNIHWFAESEKLPINFLQALTKQDRDAIFAKTTIADRVAELFRRCPDQPIPSAAIVDISSEFDDAKSRILQATGSLPGYEVLSGDEASARTIASKHNIDLKPGYYACIKKVPTPP